ncbi:hypothetical protein ACIBG7_14675 [Nonomuraea sp. NPDC050328]|uniref:hypothetical protein n=1 Tax=Nonomuraea sp. NPDC050328 TaxID=3364361 RepID=UPI0037952DB8
MNALVLRLRGDAAELAELAQRLRGVAAALTDPPPWLSAALTDHVRRCERASGDLARAAQELHRHAETSFLH